ncbi:MAG: ACP S-malonyltransferase, partial [Candidatus Aureabacteria bacterium]|nr:ACP S-malonyltransferase [Candidatus Auribacterota bacterium]
MRIVSFVFPGQGSQYIGMGKSLYENYESARRVFDKAEDILGFGLKALCFNGPEEEILKTDICQPAILTCSMAAMVVLKDDYGIIPSSCGGLSLGEYSALVCSGALEFEDAVSLVYKRGRFMQEACEETEGAMASVIGSDEGKVNEFVRRAACEGIISVANMNCPGQIVISGEKKAVRKAMEIAKSAGVRKIIELKVAGAYHSPLMESAKTKLKKVLEEVVIKKPSVKCASNVLGAFYTETDDIKALLSDQVTSPVLWQKCA